MAWFGTWAKRRKITIDGSSISNNLTHFPLPIILGASVGKSNQDVTDIFDEVGANSKRIAVTDSSGNTRLYVEIEKWDAVNEIAVLWVSRSDWVVQAGVDTDIYIYYDNTKPNNTSFVADSGGRTEVWDSDFGAVYHMAEDPDGTIVDSTGNNNDMSPLSSAATVNKATGLVGDAVEFDGNDGGLTAPDDPSISGVITQITVEALWYPIFKGFNDEDSIINKGGGFNDFAYRLEISADTNEVYWKVDSTNQNDEVAQIPFEDSSGPLLPNDTWHYIAGIYDGGAGNIDVYLDAVSKDPKTHNSANINDDANDLKLGFEEVGSGHMDGRIGEVRISKVVRSEDYLLLTHNGFEDNLNTFSASEVRTSTDTASITSLTFTPRQSSEVTAQTGDETAVVTSATITSLTSSETFQGWLAGWAKRRKITISNNYIDSDLTHFPLPVYINNNAGSGNQDVTDIFDEVGDNDKRIAITKDNGQDQLYVEIERWTSIDEIAVLWVSKSDWVVKSGESTDIYIYFDNSQADNTSFVADKGNRTEVWDSNFKAVYHLAEGSSGGTIVDSTGNNNDGGFNGTDPALLNGQRGFGLQFDGEDDYITAPDDPSISGLGAVTLDILFSVTEWRQESGDDYYEVLAGKSNWSGQREFRLRRETTNNDHGVADGDVIVWQVMPDGNDPGANEAFINQDNIAPNVAYLISGVWDSADGISRIFRNGSEQDNVSVPGTNLFDGTAPFGIGSTGDDGAPAGFKDNFAGNIWEVRLSDVRRSNAFIKASYRALNDDLNSYGQLDTESGIITDTATKSNITVSPFIATVEITESSQLSNVTITPLVGAGVTSETPSISSLVITPLDVADAPPAIYGQLVYGQSVYGQSDAGEITSADEEANNTDIFVITFQPVEGSIADDQASLTNIQLTTTEGDIRNLTLSPDLTSIVISPIRSGVTTFVAGSITGIQINVIDAVNEGIGVEDNILTDIVLSVLSVASEATGNTIIGIRTLITVNPFTSGETTEVTGATTTTSGVVTDINTSPITGVAQSIKSDSANVTDATVSIFTAAESATASGDSVKSSLSISPLESREEALTDTSATITASFTDISVSSLTSNEIYDITITALLSDIEANTLAAESDGIIPDESVVTDLALQVLSTQETQEITATGTVEDINITALQAIDNTVSGRIAFLGRLGIVAKLNGKPQIITKD